MKRQEDTGIGEMTLSYRHNESKEPLQIKVSNCNWDSFKIVANTASNVANEINNSKLQGYANDNNIPDLNYDRVNLSDNESMSDRIKLQAGSQDSKAIKMTGLGREELQAHLDKNKAEVETVAAEMRRDLAEWRENQNLQIAQLTSAVTILSSKIEGKLDSVDGDVKSINGKFEGIQGQITGINTAISGIQSGISTRLAIFGIIIAIIVAIPGIVSALKSSPSEQAASPQPIVIQLPQTQPTSLKNQQKDNSK